MPNKSTRFNIEDLSPYTSCGCYLILNDLVKSIGLLVEPEGIPVAHRYIRSACRKNRGASDFVQRFSLSSDQVCVIGDSMQRGGPDLDMKRAIPRSCGWQVDHHVPPPDIVHLTIVANVDATVSVLEHLITELV